MNNGCKRSRRPRVHRCRVTLNARDQPMIPRTQWKTVASGYPRSIANTIIVSALGASVSLCVQVRRNQIPATIASTRFPALDIRLLFG